MSFDDILDGLVEEIIKDVDKPRREEMTQYVAFVLDESGSMGSIRQSAIDAFNEQLNTLRKESDGITTYVSLTKFGGRNGLEITKPKLLETIEDMSEKDYEPYGRTPLFDAMGETVLKVANKYKGDDTDAAVLFVTITDGHENASRKYDQKMIKSLVEELEGTNRWTFTFLAANQNPLETAVRGMGMSVGNVMAFAATAEGMSSSSSSLSHSTSSYMSSRKLGLTTTGTFYGEEEKEENETD